MSASRLTVACCIATLGAGRSPSCSLSSPQDHCTVPAPNTSAPLAWRYSVRWCFGRSRAVGRPMIEQHRGVRNRRARQAERARRAVRRCPRPRPTRSRAFRSAGSRPRPVASTATLVLRHRRILPSAAGTRIARGGAVVDHEQLPREGVLRPALRRRGLKRGSRHVPVHTGVGSIFASCVRLLVGDQRAVAVLPAGLPEHLVAAEEGEVHAGIAGRLDVRALGARPVLVVADGQEGLVLADLGAEPVAVDAREVGDVVAVALQPADHRVLAVEEPVLLRRAPCREGPVVGDLVGATGRTTDVQAVAAVPVVRLPGRVRRLEQQVGPPVVVADDEEDVRASGGPSSRTSFAK